MITIERDGAVVVLTLDRPEKRNAFSIELYHALTQALLEADGNEEIGAVVLTGAGGTFSAGTDLDEMMRIANGEDVAGAADAFPGLLKALRELEVPLIGAINGPGIGLGFTMLPYFDLAVASAEARFKAPFHAMGVPPEAASSYLLPARSGRVAAARWLLLGEWISADEAHAHGLVTEVVAPDEVLERAKALASRIAERPSAARAIKRLLRAAEIDAVEAADRREVAAFTALFGRS